MDYRVISIGTIAEHELWPDQGPPRTAHATTTLIRDTGRVILVDPGLPPQVIAARLRERSGLATTAVTDVFLTNFRPEHRWGLAAFEHAKWWIAEQERERVGAMLIERFKAEDDAATRQLVQQDVAILQRCAAAPDKLAPHVDLFPLPGYTPGTCGLLLPLPRSTTLIAGDAVASVEHLEQGKVLRGAFDERQAQESLVEALEIADVIVPGYDNAVPNVTRRPF